MEKTSKFSTEDQHSYLTWEKGKKREKMLFGFCILIFGILFLLKKLGIFIPESLFYPSSILIVIGLIMLIRHKFRKSIGYILVGIGLFIKLNDYYPEIIDWSLFLPIALIFAGASMVIRAKFGKRNKTNTTDWKSKMGAYEFNDQDISLEDFVDSVSIFGGVKKQVTSKNFKGADLVTIFGATEINLMQADFENKIIIDLTTVLGGAEIIVPSDWQVQSEIVAILGGFEDNRHTLPIEKTADKIVLLRGTCVLGGVEVKSYSAQ